MLRTFILFSLVIFLFKAGPALGTDNIDDILEGIKKKYHALPGLTMDYSREVITRSMSMLGGRIKGDLATGQIFFKPPCMLRLEQREPASETIIFNNDKLWWYIPEKKQAYLYSSRKFGKELRLLSNLFRGLIKAEDNFIVKLVSPGNEKTGYRIELKQDPPSQEIDHILLSVSNEYDIRAVDIHNQFGGITRFKLNRLAVKKMMENDFFEFKASEGIKIIKGEASQ